jgi:hypothetical protein
MDTALLNKTTGLLAGDQLILMDMRIAIKTQGDFSFNNALAGAILRNIIGSVDWYTGYAGGLGFGHGYSLNQSGAISSSSTGLVFEIYDSLIIPASANNEATGTLLWKKTYVDPSQGQNSLFYVVGNSVTLSASMSANAIASGTPKYLRIYKEGIETTDTRYPKLVIQVPVNTGGNGFATVDRNTVTAGQSMSLNEITMLFQF